MTRFIRGPISCKGRGPRMAQPLSRRRRFNSATIVADAYVEKRTSRCGSKRSMALSKPMLATWARSSTDSPRPAKYSAKDRNEALAPDASFVEETGRPIVTFTV